MTFCCSGIGISTTHSIAVGKVHKLQQGALHIQPRFILPSQTQQEIQRFKTAINQAEAELINIKQQLPDSTPADIVDFINTHLLMLDDQALCESVEELIEKKLAAAEWALQTRRNELVQLFDEMQDAYLRTRKDDLDHVINRVQKKLLNKSANVLMFLQKRCFNNLAEKKFSGGLKKHLEMHRYCSKERIAQKNAKLGLIKEPKS